MELTLAQQTDQHDTQVSVICDGQFSHTFDLLTLVPNTDKKPLQPVDDPIAYGKAIYQALFPAGTKAQLGLSSTPKRLLLIPTRNDLDAVAWEYAYGPDGFLILKCHFVRGLPVEQRIDAPLLDRGLYIVAVPSNPLSDKVDQLNIDGEWLRLKEIIQSVSSALTLERTRPPTLQQVRRLVANQSNRVVHFMGHGEQRGADAALCFEKEDGDLELVRAETFVRRMNGSVFLVTLNACESAKSGESPFSNLAAALVRERPHTPYALGMRQEIPDEDARPFSRTFYDELARGSTVEEALFQARLTLADSSRPWAVGVPVLYTSLKIPAPGYKLLVGRPVVKEYQPHIDASALPRAPGIFQGRIEELKKLGGALTRDSRKRMVTIHGGGGQGKTALAREAVERFAYAWPGGVWATTLESLPKRAILVSDLARFLGISTQEIPDPREVERQVMAKLSLQRTLIVLDNAETLTEAVETNDTAAIDLAEFLQQLPSLYISLLVTSRRLGLGWDGEVLVELGGLTQAEGAALFRQSAPAKEIKPGLVERLGISERLEGHPLGLRLLGNAFNASTLPLDAFMNLYDDHLAQAENKYIGLDHRQRSLYACIEASLRYLSNDLRALLSGLRIFRGPFFSRIAAVVFDPTEKQTEESLARVQSNIDKLWQRGFLTPETVKASDGALELYRLLPTTRSYVERQMELTYDREMLMRRLGRELLQFTTELYWKVNVSAMAVASAQQIRQDIEQSIEWVQGVQQGYYLSMWGWIQQRLGNVNDASELLDRAQKIAHEDRALEALVLNTKGMIQENTGHLEKALTFYQQALNISRQVGDRPGEATVLSNMGGIYRKEEKLDQALNYYRQALPILQPVKDREQEAQTLNSMATVYQGMSQLDQARTLYEQALPIRREVGDRVGEGVTLNNLAEIYQRMGQLDQARTFYEQALAIRQGMGDRAGEGISLSNLGLVYRDMGPEYFDKALDSYGQASQILIEVGDQAGEAVAYINMAAIYQRKGQIDQALEYYKQASNTMPEGSNRSVEATMYSNMATLYQATGKPEQALESYRQALSIMREVKNRQGEAIALNGIGWLYHNTKEPERALDYYQQALTAIREVGNRGVESAFLKNMASLLYDHLNRRQEAVSYMEQAVAVLEQAGLARNATGKTIDELRQALATMRSGT